MIQIKQLAENQFEVTVTDSTETSHIVDFTEDYYQSLTGGKIDKSQLIKQSFEFLLEREPNTMIMRKFNLKVIETYFPEYPRVIKP